MDNALVDRRHDKRHHPHIGIRLKLRFLVIGLAYVKGMSSRAEHIWIDQYFAQGFVFADICHDVEHAGYGATRGGATNFIDPHFDVEAGCPVVVIACSCKAHTPISDGMESKPAQ